MTVIRLTTPSFGTSAPASRGYSLVRPSGVVTAAVPTLVPLAIGAGNGPSNLATTRGWAVWPTVVVIITGTGMVSGTLSCVPSQTGASLTTSPARKIVVLLDSRKHHSIRRAVYW